MERESSIYAVGKDVSVNDIAIPNSIYRFALGHEGEAMNRIREDSQIAGL
jgi:hypothetical protein